MSDPSAVKTQQEDLVSNCRLELESKQIKQKRKEILQSARYRIAAIRIIINLFAVASLALVAWLVFELLSEYQTTLKDEYNCHVSVNIRYVYKIQSK